MSDAEEIAKAIQEAAKLGVKGVEVSEKVGSFFVKVFREPIDEISGMVTDKLRFLRWKRIVNMSVEVDKILAERGVVETRAVQAKLALPIFENVSLEDDESLKKLWNNLLANAMDPSFFYEIKYGYIDIIKTINSLDVAIINQFYIYLKGIDGLNFDKLMDTPLSKESFLSNLNINNEQYCISVHNLIRVQVLAPFSPDALRINTTQGVLNVAITHGIEKIVMTPLGVRFTEACIK